MRTALRALPLVAVLALVLVAGNAAIAGAPIFVVTKDADTLDGSCDADCSLREAIVAANGAGAPAIINLPPFEYKITRAGTGEDAAETGDFDITGSLTIQGLGDTPSIVNGDQKDTVFHVLPGADLSLNFINVIGGGGPDALAGGIYGEGPVLLRNVKVLANATSTAGAAAGIYMTEPATILDSELASNVADSGGIAGAIYTTDTLAIERTSFTGNVAVADGVAGGISTKGDLYLTDVDFNGNVASVPNSAGGLLIADDPLPLAQLNRVTFTGNIANGFGSSGGIRAEANITATDLAMDGNVGGHFGAGGIHIVDGMLAIERAVFNGNISDDEGAGAIFAAATADVTNATFVQNVGQYGAVFVDNEGDLTLEHDTFLDNLVYSVYNEGEATVRNTILAFTNDDGSVDNCGGTDPFAVDFNIDTNNSCDFDTEQSNVQPIFGPFGDNGGFVRTVVLQPGSPGLDQALHCPEPFTDARFFGRPVNGQCDVGAVESGSDLVRMFGDFDCDGALTVLDGLALISQHADVEVDLPDGCPGIGDQSLVEGNELLWSDLSCNGEEEAGDLNVLLAHLSGVDIIEAECPGPGAVVFTPHD